MTSLGLQPSLTPPTLDLDALRRTVSSGATRDLDSRRGHLLALRDLVTQHEAELTEAVHADVGKPALEVRLTELSPVLREIDDLLRNLETWTAPRPVALPATHVPGSAHVQLQPKGVVLVIGPWNYPVQLVLSPLAGALAAGNTAVVKPSEQTPTVAALLARLMAQHLPADVVAVVTGGVTRTTELLEERFDHIFFTGSTRVGRIVMKAAAEHLTPVTLELGGKSPTFVDATVDLDIAARRIAWGKFTNAGQTCIAPDYVLVTKEAKEGLLASLKEAVIEFFGAYPQHSADLGRIINAAQHERLVALLESSGGEVVVGGGHDAADRNFLAPTVIADVPLDAGLMQEEIFGPILPVLTVADAAEAIAIIGSRERPLALYVFSEDDVTREAFESQTVSGGLAYGAALIHLTVPSLPFGGVGGSGMGSYLGRASIEELSHHRSVLSKPLRPDTLAVIYPPYPAWKRSAVRALMAPMRRSLVNAQVPATLIKGVKGAAQKLPRAMHRSR
ncbi:MAG: aldehyde dehydrogenase family protein [Ornithinimicrobium sp.]|uniref:aldehyde dehydrogenase family protein n=1 Tax=Ornithinimicrobium sp. TaxID=1977084 RepID=UPI0026DFFDF8|nr:aldehyde dehydrogenase family protein [Ornithinimicrobium sp.]MDO5740419.1 aldehyde dehydrogenase family protein [Ornithinimicrobium sp.]